MYSILFMKQMSFNEGNSMTLALVYFYIAIISQEQRCEAQPRDA